MIISAATAVPQRFYRHFATALARAGKIKEFTGISDPYETPENAEMVIDTIDISPDLAAHRILVKLESMGFIR